MWCGVRCCSVVVWRCVVMCCPVVVQCIAVRYCVVVWCGSVLCLGVLI